MRVCSPHCGVAPETVSGGETYEREILTRLGRAGVAIDLGVSVRTFAVCMGFVMLVPACAWAMALKRTHGDGSR